MRVQVSLNIESSALPSEDRILFQQDLTSAMQKDARYDQIVSIVNVLEKELTGKLIAIDAVGINFPDAQLKDRILRVAEVPKKITLYKADEDISDSQLVAQLEEHPEVSILQFTNAVAAVYHANLGLLSC
jgi:hypothetical protein